MLTQSPPSAPLDRRVFNDRMDNETDVRSSEVASEIPPWLQEYLMRRRQALLMEVVEIEKMLNIPPSKGRVLGT